jgi:hypothetical protein
MAANRIRSVLFVAAAGFLLAFGATGDAAPKVAPVHVPIVQGLHQTRTLLQGADHDYAGYRSKAVHEVTKAIHALNPPRGQTTPPRKGPPDAPAPPGAAKPRVREPQAVSDMQLQQALKQLHFILNQLGSLPGHARTSAAMVHVRHAIQDLHAALKIN